MFIGDCKKDGKNFYRYVHDTQYTDKNSIADLGEDTWSIK